jgi:hypothetical protein
VHSQLQGIGFSLQPVSHRQGSHISR